MQNKLIIKGKAICRLLKLSGNLSTYLELRSTKDFRERGILSLILFRIIAGTW